MEKLSEIVDLILQIVFDFDFKEKIVETTYANFTPYFGEEFFLSWICAMFGVGMISECIDIDKENIPISKQIKEFLIVLLSTFFYTNIGFYFVNKKLWFVIHAIFALLMLVVFLSYKFYKWYKKNRKKAIAEISAWIVSVASMMSYLMIFEPQDLSIFFAIGFIAIFVVTGSIVYGILITFFRDL